MKMEAIVEYNYMAQEPDELTLKKGDIIKEIKVMVGGWWEGTLRDKRGMFPDNFVKVIEPPSTASGSGGESTMNTKPDSEVTLRNGSGRRFCKVLYSYEPCNEDELTLVPQESIEFLGELEEGWWKGKLRGRVGVFPSNFVSPPVTQELPELQEKHKDRDKIELCRVLFPYEANNEDELTLAEGDVITLLSRDAPDKGWWKGELRGQIGLFPDNFVEVITSKNEDQEHWHENTGSKSITKNSHGVRKNEKAHVRRSLDAKNLHTDTNKKIASAFPSLSPSASSTIENKKSVGNHSIMSSLKRFVTDSGANNNGNNGSGNEELDGVERGEGAPLSHLTASRAKAPRRRPPSSQHLRHGAGSTASTPLSNAVLDDNLANGNAETTLDQLREDEGDGAIVSKTRRKAPWVEELKINQERRKIASIDRLDKVEVKKERRLTPINVGESNIKLEPDHDDVKPKDKERSPRTETMWSDLPSRLDRLQSPISSPGPPAFVPYNLYSELLERVASLEEKHALLQQTVGQLTEQLIPLLANAAINSKV